MSQVAKQQPPQQQQTVSNPLNPDNLKPCCACPDTKNARDICLLQSAEGEIACKDLIEAHKKCMSAYGFKV